MNKAQIGDVVPNNSLGINSGACNIAPAAVPVEPPMKTEVERTAEEMGVTVAKLQAMRAYAARQVALARQKGHKIKPSTVSSLVKKNFNVKTR